MRFLGALPKKAATAKQPFGSIVGCIKVRQHRFFKNCDYLTQLGLRDGRTHIYI
jgi:hypothetical protein